VGHKRTGEPYDRKARVSLRVELVRIGVRWFIKRRRHPTVAAARRSIRAAAKWIPSPPAGTDVRAVNAGGIPASSSQQPHPASIATCCFFTAAAM
jgi:hypothetical protein